VRDFRSTSFLTLPVNDFKRGDFSRLLNPAFTGNARSGTAAGMDALGRPVVFGALYDPATTRTENGRTVRDVFPGNTIPQNRWSPVSRNILTLAPITDALFDTMLNNTPALGACCLVFDETMLTLKGDHHIGAAHRLSAVFNRNFRVRNNSGSPRWGIPPNTPTGVYQLQETPGTMVRLAHDWTVRPTVLNHFAIGYNRFGNLNQSVYVDQGWPEKIGLQNVPGTHFPVLTFSGQPHQGGNIGAGGRLGSGNRGGSYNGSTIVQNDTTVIRGRPNFKIGFEHRAYYYNTHNKSGSGDFAFSAVQTELPGFRTETGHSFASFLLGAVSTTSRSVAAANFGHRWRSSGLYFMDDWKTTRKLTLNLGLRWETVAGLYEVAGRMSGLGFIPNAAAGGREGALVFADELGRKGFMDRNWRQFSPKVGFAYALTEQAVLRGGYGINNTPPISNGFGFGGTLGFNGSISRNSGNTRCVSPKIPSCTCMTATPTSQPPCRTEALPRLMVLASTSIRRTTAACLMCRTGASAFSTSCRPPPCSK
jgi:outer membrane receptor protein involved in Fe transport